MSYLDDLVAQSLASQEQSYLDTISKSQSAAQASIDSQQSALNKQADELLGFKKGLIAPAYQGTQAGVLSRDNLGLQSSSGYAVQVVGTEASPIGKYIGYAIVGYLAYKFFIKKGRK